MESILSLDEFQKLPSERQSEEIFKLLALLSPFACEVSALKGNMDLALDKIVDMDAANRNSGVFAVKELTGKELAMPETIGSEAETFCLSRDPDSPHSATPLLPETLAPDPFIIQKSRQLNRRVTLNVGGVRHEVGRSFWWIFLGRFLKWEGRLLWWCYGLSDGQT